MTTEETAGGPRRRDRRGQDAPSPRARVAACVDRGSRRRADAERVHVRQRTLRPSCRGCACQVGLRGPLVIARARFARVTFEHFPTPSYSWKETPMLKADAKQLAVLGSVFVVVAGPLAAAATRTKTPSVDPTLAAQGKDIFRHDTFGDETFWTDTLMMNEVIQTAVDPTTALARRPEGRRRGASGRRSSPACRTASISLTEPGDDDRAAEAEGGGRRRGHRRERQRHRHADAGRDHVRALPFDRRRFVHEGDRQAAGRLGERRPESGRDHRAVARARYGDEGDLQRVGQGQVRPALQPGPHERAAGDPARVRPAGDQQDHLDRRRRQPRVLEPLRRRSRRWADTVRSWSRARAST